MSAVDDTIAAIATPVGQAGIGIIRVSGPRSVDIATEIFRPKTPVPSLRSHRLYLGYLVDPTSEDVIDEVLLSYMKAPNSFTRQDVVEINSHSGYLLLSRVLGIVLKSGARLAEPGEFTLRAFLNGRIDLTQAEAVIDLINARSRRGLSLASRQIRGAFRDDIETLRRKALAMLSRAEVALDYPDEDAGIMSGRDTAREIETGMLDPIRKLIEAHARKRFWVDGVCTVIAGRVNAGKSSLLNRLLDEPRAIVTPIPGTTRDIVESTVTIDGLPLRLMDTAGFRQVHDEVEQIGIHLTEQKLDEADLVLVVVDKNRPLNEDDANILDRCRGKNALVVINKTDLPRELDTEALRSLSEPHPMVEISALTGEGIDALRQAVVRSVLEGGIDVTSSHAPSNLRHRKALADAAVYFENAACAVRDGAPMEIVALELTSGLDSLGELIGHTTHDDLLDTIFSRFCLGK